MAGRNLLAALVVTALCAASPAHANKVKRLQINPIADWDRAPELEVYSTNGERYTDVDRTDTSRVSVRLRAECQYEGRGNKAYKGEIQVPGFVRVGAKEPANFLIPHADEASAVFRWDGGNDKQLDPVQACNDELERLASTTPKSRLQLLAEGFEARYPASLNVVYSFRCEATGLGRTDLDSDRTLVNTRIDCKASSLAADKLPSDGPKPKRAVIVPARAEPLLKAGSFVAEPEVHTGECPATIRFVGSLTATRAGTVRYRYTRFDGTQSPEFSLRFDKAGTLKTRDWQTTYSAPNAQTTLSTGAGNESDDFAGWYRLDILSPKPEGQIAAHYRVLCGADDEAPAMQLKSVPVQRMEVQPAEVVKPATAPAPQRKVE